MADDLLVLNQQFAAKQEVTPGTAVALAAADVNLKPFQSSLSFAPDYTRFGNDEVAEDIGAAADFVAGKPARLGFGCAFHGSGVLATEPAVMIYLEALGCKKSLVKAAQINAPSGGDAKFLAGESYSAASGTKTGVVDQDITGSGSLRYVPATGGDLVATDVVTANGDSATVQSSPAPSTYGWKAQPLSFGHKTLTVQRGTKNAQGTAAKDFLIRLRGALGTGRIECTALDALRLISEFTGVLDFAGNGSLFTGVDYESFTNLLQPKFVNATCQIDAIAVKPSSFTFDFGNAVEMVPDPTTTGGTAGYDYARIANREPKFTIDPLRSPADNLDDIGYLGDGRTFAAQIIVGTTPNIIEISAAKCQIRGWSEQVRAGRHAAALELFVTRTDKPDYDWAIYFR